MKIEEENNEEVSNVNENIKLSPLMIDENFKIMFNNIEPLTVLVSRILEVPYEEIKGKVKPGPLTEQKRKRERKKKKGILLHLFQ